MSQMWCHKCKKRLGASQARIVVDGNYICQECAYYAEMGVEPPKAGK